MACRDKYGNTASFFDTKKEAISCVKDYVLSLGCFKHIKKKRFNETKGEVNYSKKPRLLFRLGESDFYLAWDYISWSWYKIVPERPGYLNSRSKRISVTPLDIVDAEDERVPVEFLFHLNLFLDFNKIEKLDGRKIYFKRYGYLRGFKKPSTFDQNLSYDGYTWKAYLRSRTSGVFPKPRNYYFRQVR